MGSAPAQGLPRRSNRTELSNAWQPARHTVRVPYMTLATINQKQPAAEGSRLSVPESIITAFAAPIPQFPCGGGREGLQVKQHPGFCQERSELPASGAQEKDLPLLRASSPLWNQPVCRRHTFYPPCTPNPSTLQGQAPGSVCRGPPRAWPEPCPQPGP